MPRKTTSQQHDSQSPAITRSASAALRSLRHAHPLCAALALAGVLGALALGLFARFKGLGAAPLAVDEYFLVRSTQNVLRHGWPVFDCGGIYSRGLLQQYLSAFLSRIGLSLDVASRLIAALSSLIALPAAFILGWRVRGKPLGLLVLAVLALSVWEVEMARFARMYAPFQAVFLWYLVYFLRRTVDNDPRADWPMIALTVLGALLWEGAALLALANFMPVFLQRRSLSLSRREWIGLIKHAAVLAAVYWFVTADFRTLSPTPALPLDYDPSVSDGNTSDGIRTAALSLWEITGESRIWMAAFMVPLLASALAVLTLWRRRTPPLLLTGLIGALTAALAHQFLLTAAILIAMPLFRFSSFPQLRSREVRGVYVAIGFWALFWLSLRWVTWSSPGGGDSSKAVLTFLWPLMSFPDVINQLIVPWGRAVPRLGIGLVVLLGLGLFNVLRQDESGVSNERALYAVAFCLVLAACMGEAPRQETRYVFFLYPAAVVLALASIQTLIEAGLGQGADAAIAAPLLGLGVFMLSEDFQPRHLLEIDRPASVFRLDLPRQRAHLVPRTDTRALARWLRTYADGRGDVVINAFQSLDYYDSKVDFFYVDRTDFNFASYACRYGTIDRWSNRPLLQSVDGIKSVVSTSAKTYLVTYFARVEPLVAQLRRYQPVVAWSDGSVSVIELAAAGSRIEVPAVKAASQ